MCTHSGAYVVRLFIFASQGARRIRFFFHTFRRKFPLVLNCRRRKWEKDGMYVYCKWYWRARSRKSVAGIIAVVVGAAREIPLGFSSRKSPFFLSSKLAAPRSQPAWGRRRLHYSSLWQFFSLVRDSSHQTRNPSDMLTAR